MPLAINIIYISWYSWEKNIYSKKFVTIHILFLREYIFFTAYINLFMEKESPWYFFSSCYTLLQIYNLHELNSYFLLFFWMKTIFFKIIFTLLQILLLATLQVLQPPGHPRQKDGGTGSCNHNRIIFGEMSSLRELKRHIGSKRNNQRAAGWGVNFSPLRGICLVIL